MTVLLGWTQPVLGPAKVLFDIKRVQSPFSTRSGLAFLAQDWDREQWPIPEGYWMSQICGSIVQCVPYSGMSRQMNPTRLLLTTGSSFRVVSLNQMINKWLALNAQSTMTFISVWSIKIKCVLLTTGKRSHAQHENYLSKLNISPTPAGRWNTTLNTVCSPPAGNKDLGLEYILLTKGQWVGGLHIELSLSQHSLYHGDMSLTTGRRVDRAISLNTFSLPRWHVTYHWGGGGGGGEGGQQTELSLWTFSLLTTMTHHLPQWGEQTELSLSTHSPNHSDTSLTTGRTAETFCLPQWHITYHREDSRHFLLTTVTHLLTTVTCLLPQGGQQTLSPYHGDTSLTTGRTADTFFLPQWHITYHKGERGCGHFPGTSPRGGCRARWCRTSSRTRPPSHQSAPRPCRPGCPPQWPRRSGPCSCDPLPPTSCRHERRWGSPSAEKGKQSELKPCASQFWMWWPVQILPEGKRGESCVRLEQPVRQLCDSRQGQHGLHHTFNPQGS